VAGLPPSAYEHRAWWSNERQGSHVQAIGWLDAGRRVESVDLDTTRVTFSLGAADLQEVPLANDSIYLMSGDELVEMRSEP
jgi:hypothetical protein